MPLPLLIGLAVVAGGWGVKKGVDAKDDFDSAKRLNSRAKKIFNSAKEKLETERSQTQSTMERLGERKFNMYKDQVIPFVDTFSKIKNLDFKDKEIIENGLTGFDESQLKDLKSSALGIKDVVGGGITSVGAGGLAGMAVYGGIGSLGYATGGVTAISGLSGAAATNATLAWLGGGSLASGGMGMAGGAAVLGGIVAGPVLAIGGMMLASKAEEAKHDAWGNVEKAELAAEEMKTAVVATRGIKTRFVEVNELLRILDIAFKPQLAKLVTLIATTNNYTEFTEQQKKEVYQVFQLAVTIKNILEAPIITKKGELNKVTGELVKSTKKLH
jgi:hypothetical protein